MKHRIFLFCTILFLIQSISSRAQMSHADSSFVNSISTEQTYISYWNKPGTWFDNPEVSSLSSMYDLIDQNFKFETTEFTNCNSTLSVPGYISEVTFVNQTIQQFEDTTGIFIYGLDKPFRQLDFSLGLKTGKTFAIMDSSHVANGQRDIAFLVITGTGANLAKNIIDGIGYHNTNCFTNNLIHQIGDVFIPIVLNDELRAI